MNHFRALSLTRRLTQHFRTLTTEPPPTGKGTTAATGDKGLESTVATGASNGVPPKGAATAEGALIERTGGTRDRGEEPKRWIGQTPLSERLHPNQRNTKLDSQKGVEQFLDIGMGAGARRTGRTWRISELRLKSFDDLHRLWYILLKERNILLTEKAWCKTNGRYWSNGVSNTAKVAVSMARLKTVVGERMRATRARHAAIALQEKVNAKRQRKRAAAEASSSESH